MQNLPIEDAMPKLSPAPLTFYPAYCFPVSPTFNTWAKVTATEVHTLQEHQGFEGQKIYFQLNHPMKWICIVGVIVAFDAHPTRWILTIDDSSGETLDITCPRPVANVNPTNAATVAVDEYNGSNVLSDIFRTETKNNTVGITATGLSIDLAGVDVGSIVKVKGGIGEFRGVRQMTLEKISIIHTTNDEAAAWSELSHFRATILSQPWLVSQEEQKRLLEEADGTRRREEERLRRRQERERKMKANRKISSTRKVEGRIDAKTAKDMAPEASRNEGRSREKRQRRVSDKATHARAEGPEGDGVWAREEVERQRDAAIRNRHRRAKGVRRDPPEVVIATVVSRVDT